MKTVLLWIAVLPGAFLATIVFAISLRFTERNFPIQWDGLRSVFLLIQNACQGAIFVGVGAAIAPKFRSIVAVILCSLIVLLSGAGFVLGLIGTTSVPASHLVLASISAVIGAALIIHDELKQARNSTNPLSSRSSP